VVVPLAFDAAFGEAAHEIALRDQEDDGDRNARENGGCGKVTPEILELVEVEA
jgi:hypothetical protein